MSTAAPFTIADVVNAPTEFTLVTDGKTETFRLRQPDQLEQGTFQRWLEQLAFEAIDRRTYQDEATKLKCLKQHDDSCAAGDYEWLGEIATRRVMTPKGMAKLLSIVCQEAGARHGEGRAARGRQRERNCGHHRFKADKRPKSTGGDPGSFRVAKRLLLVRLTNPPFGGPKDAEAVARLSDDQLIVLYGRECDGDGRPVLKMPALTPPTPFEAFRTRCYANGVSDPVVVKSLWAERQKAARARDAKQPRRRRR